MNQQTVISLSDDQILYLEEFCEKKGVKYYEVQIELVDHLANAIEDQMTKDNNSTFDSALAQVYKSFGVTGFRKLIIEKEKLANKHANKIFVRHLQSFFKLPHILLIFSLFAIFTILFQYLNTDIYLLTNVVKTIAIGAMVLKLIIMIIFFLKKRHLNKSLLHLSVLPGYWAITLPSYALFSFAFDHFISTEPKIISNINQYVFISAIIIYTIIASIAIFQCYNKMFHHARISYPQAFR